MKLRLKLLTVLCVLLPITLSALAKEYHVSINGNDTNNGSKLKPFKTISAAAAIAQPGDKITVHRGTYRERINPPRGGISDSKRITYQAAKDEKVTIKGSETIKGWKQIKKDTWIVTIPNNFFGQFNPYSDLIAGDWFGPLGRQYHTGSVYLNNHWLIEAKNLEDVLKPIGDAASSYFDQPDQSPLNTDWPKPDSAELRLWFADVNETTTTIWAQFKDINPNDSDVEINVRQSVFYPDKTGINFITVQGFTMSHAATPWSPPTTEQIGLIGTNWSKGWIIKDNDISYSTCVGVTLGKYGDQGDNKPQDSAEDYVNTINKGLKNGWSKENIGHHKVRNNHISHCEQAGLVGSLGAVFSEITDNTIHDIHVRRLFSGAEMAGIKIHASIDMLIQGNYIHHCEKGIWLDWMAQGTRVTSNLCHDNITMDLFMEVNHGPYVVDNNIFLSREFLWDWSQGGCFAHNLIGGKIYIYPQDRQTPYHKPHSTTVAALHDIPGGDNRFYNNIFLDSTGLGVYQNSKSSVVADGNIYLNNTIPFPDEKNNIKLPQFNPNVKIVEKNSSVYLHITLPEINPSYKHKFVTTDMLGQTLISNAHFENYDGNPLQINSDYFGQKRNTQNPTPGPFEAKKQGQLILKVR